MSEFEYLKVINGDELGDYDPDHSEAARIFYMKYWGESLSNDFSDYDGKQGNYRGDTIISFNTIAGCVISLLSIFKENTLIMPPTGYLECQEDRLRIIMNAEDLPNCIRTKFELLYYLYHSFANLMPLVAEKGNHNLNTPVKSGFYRDFPDLFFSDIRNFYLTGKCNKHFLSTESKINEEYFKKFGDKASGVGGWIKYVESNFLEAFFKQDDVQYETPIKLKPDIPIPYRTSTANLPQSEKDKQMEKIDLFLSNAISIINRRAKILSMAEV